MKTPPASPARRPAGKPARRPAAVSLGADEPWRLTDVAPQRNHFRQYVEIGDGAGEAGTRLPVVITPGSRYIAALEETEVDHADPAAPMLAKRGTERRLTLGVTTRDDHRPGRAGRQRDKVQLAFNDTTGGRRLSVDIERPEPRFIAFDVQFDPIYELAPDDHYVMHFQALQVGMFRTVLEDAGQPPFSIRVQGTTAAQPDPMAPISLRLERRWYGGRGDEVQEEVLQDRLPPLQRGRWYRFVLRLLPGYDRGGIALWHWDLSRAYDRCDAPIDTWDVPWGYRPVPSGDPAVDRKRRTIQYALGIYRRSSATTQRLHLRNIRFGTTYDAVVPGPPC